MKRNNDFEQRADFDMQARQTPKAMKSIYREDDLSLNDEGRDVSYMTKLLLDELFKKYKGYDPREIAAIIMIDAGLAASREIIMARMGGTLKRKKP